MGEQQSLFGDGGPLVGGQPQGNPAHLARRHDPAQSHEAARGIVKHLGTLQQEVFEAIKAHPHKTLNELSELCGLRDPRKYGRRLNELRKAGRIREYEIRRCAITGRKAAVWEVV